MAFADYAFLLKPGLEALARIPQHVKKAKADDGKISVAEFFGIWMTVGLDMIPYLDDIIRAERLNAESALLYESLPEGSFKRKHVASEVRRLYVIIVTNCYKLSLGQKLN